MQNQGITIKSNLNIIDGSLEMNNYSSLDIWGNLTIFSGAGLNANDTDPMIELRGGWLNFNTAYDIAYGFNPGSSSTVRFDGDTDQHIITAAPVEDFYNIYIHRH